MPTAAHRPAPLSPVRERARAALAACLLAGLAACGGGAGGDGGGGSGSDPATVVPAPAEVAARSSYANRLARVSAPRTLPADVVPNNPHVFADFDGDGITDFFTAQLTYSPGNPIGQATPADYRFYRGQADGSWVRVMDWWAALPSGHCIHPRQTLVADLNADGRPDVFVACHGYDASPFPGERNNVVLSQAGGGWRVVPPNDAVGFHHGAALFDFDADGLPDVLLANNADPERLYVWRNLGDGRFARDARYLMPAALRGKNYFIVDVLDVDGDGRSDIAVGGHEWEFGSLTKVILNRGDNHFQGAVPVDLPTVPGYGVVLDFVVTGSGADRALWLLRSGGETGGANFYVGTALQRIVWSSRTATTPLVDRALPWTQQFFPTTIDGAAVMSADYLPTPFAVPR
jgi:hypothetical protein